MITEVLPLEPTLAQIEEVCEKLLKTKERQWFHDKFLVEFNKPSTVIKGGHYKTVTKMKANFFKTIEGTLCYSLGTRSKGWKVEQTDYKNIKSISIPSEEDNKIKDELKLITNAVKALKLLHPNAWDDIKIELLEDPQNYANCGNFLKICTPLKYKQIYIVDGVEEERTAYKSVFDPWVLDNIKKAFDNKTDYRYEVSRRTCSISVECKLSPDGTFRAWYTRRLNDPKSGKYQGCGGREYNYLLLNPTTAWFYERD